MTESALDADILETAIVGERTRDADNHIQLEQGEGGGRGLIVVDYATRCIGGSSNARWIIRPSSSASSGRANR